MARHQTIEADYLVVGCGAAGMAFTDALITASPGVEVVMVDRRHAPGGHWLEAYPFVRLHQPSAYYGVNSRPLGTEAIDRHGPNKGWYERASAAEICAYFERVMTDLLDSGRVRYLPLSDYQGEHRIVSRVSGDETTVKVRKKVVDARYLETSVPASSPPPFEVSAEARCVPVNQLVDVKEQPDGYVIIGAGKTALDACCWLLDQGVPADDIRWVKPREAWFLNRAFAQGGELVGTLLEGLARQVEAAAQATSVDDLFERLEHSGQLLRIDKGVTPTMFRGPTVSEGEVAQLRQIAGTLRLGKLRRIERSELVFDEGRAPTSPRQLHVHCAAQGLNPAPAVPIFTERSITLQSIRTGLIPFNAALTAFVEARRDDVAEKNRLCPPNPQPNAPLDWLRGTLNGLQADALWGKEPDLAAWLEASRLNTGRGLRARAKDPSLQGAWGRFAKNARPGVANLERLLKG